MLNYRHYNKMLLFHLSISVCSMGISSCYQNFLFQWKRIFKQMRKRQDEKKQPTMTTTTSWRWYLVHSPRHTYNRQVFLYKCVCVCAFKKRISVAIVHNGKLKVAFFIGQGVGRCVKLFTLLMLSALKNCLFS